MCVLSRQTQLPSNPPEYAKRQNPSLAYHLVNSLGAPVSTRSTVHKVVLALLRLSRTMPQCQYSRRAPSFIGAKTTISIYIYIYINFVFLKISSGELERALLYESLPVTACQLCRQIQWLRCIPTQHTVMMVDDFMLTPRPGGPTTCSQTVSCSSTAPTAPARALSTRTN